MRLRDETECRCGNIKHRLSDCCRVCYERDRPQFYNYQVNSKIDEDTMQQVLELNKKLGQKTSATIRCLIEWGLESYHSVG